MGHDHPVSFPLSVVATSRNDNHGGSLTHRMQHFVDGFVAQCRRHNLRAELILVEWNPPVDRPPLAEALRWPQDPGPCEIRIITVPREIHHRLEHSNKLPLFQMIAKNVGIRRARGRFVLATNVDILFTNEAVCFMRDRLKPGRLYRADRLDVPAYVPSGVSFDKVLDYCQQESFRMHATGFTLVRRNGRWDPSSLFAAFLGSCWREARSIAIAAVRQAFAISRAAGVALVEISRLVARSMMHRVIRFYRVLITHQRLEDRVSDPVAIGDYLQESFSVLIAVFRDTGIIAANKARFLSRVSKWVYWALIRRQLFTNACGDYTLLSRDDWFALRGYLEWPMYSFHIDSLLLYQAHYHGIREIYMGPRAHIFHIDHEAGSGFTPEAADKLFMRLKAENIPCLNWEQDVVPIIQEMEMARNQGKSVLYNGDSWGFGDIELPEQIVRRAGQRNA